MHRIVSIFRSGAFRRTCAARHPGSAGIRSGARKFSFCQRPLGNRRQITLSRPANFGPKDPELVVALIFDGVRAISEMDAPRMLDSLTRQKRLPPVLSVFIPSIDSETRSRELPENADFADSLADELLPEIARLTGIRPSPQRTVLAGASYGGLGAATIALHRPEAFGNVPSMSGPSGGHRKASAPRARPMSRRAWLRSRPCPSASFYPRDVSRPRAAKAVEFCRPRAFCGTRSGSEATTWSGANMRAGMNIWSGAARWRMG
nr:alpha/beta hydrolase-fold protein [Paracoccus ravus]